MPATHPISVGARSSARRNFGYGGLWLEYLIAPMRLVHGSVGTLIGAGALNYHRFRGTAGQPDSDTDTVFVLDPTVAAEVNVTPHLRVSLGAGYRVVRGVALDGLGNADAGGFTLGGAVKLGSF